MNLGISKSQVGGQKQVREDDFANCINLLKLEVGTWQNRSFEKSFSV